MTWKNRTEFLVNEHSAACYVAAKIRQSVHVSTYTNNYLLGLFPFSCDM